MTIRPMNDRLLIQPLEEPDVLPSGLVVPEAAQRKPQKGIVVAAGPGAIATKTGARIPMSVDEGDYVLFGRHAGEEVSIGGEVFRILREGELLGTFVPQPAG